MLSVLDLAVFLLLATRSAHTTLQQCQCSAALPAGLKVNCSSANLMELSNLPSDTTELFVQDNRLTSVSPGLFDRLVGLEKVSLSGNPFHCDCRIQYLRNWLLKNRAVLTEEPTCDSPSPVAHRAITDLSDDYFSTCAMINHTGWIVNTIMGAMLCCLIVLLLWNLRLAKMSTITLYIYDRHSGFEADTLHSLRPKHKRTWGWRQRWYPELSEGSQSSDSLTYTEDLEKPFLNMELLPQVLDTLHKRHNIRISVPEEPL